MKKKLVPYHAASTLSVSALAGVARRIEHDAFHSVLCIDHGIYAACHSDTARRMLTFSLSVLLLRMFMF